MPAGWQAAICPARAGLRVGESQRRDRLRLWPAERSGRRRGRLDGLARLPGPRQQSGGMPGTPAEHEEGEMLFIDRWIGAYGRAWEDRDDQAVAELFTQDAIYRLHPFGEPTRGRERSPPIRARRPPI